MISDLVIAKNDSNLVGCCCVGGAPSCETACDRNRKKGDLLFKLMIKQMKNVFIFVIFIPSENFPFPFVLSYYYLLFVYNFVHFDFLMKFS